MYTFDMETDPLVRRLRPSRAHYELRDVDLMGGDVAVWAILDPEKTLDEQLAIQAQFTNQLADTIGPLPEELQAKVATEEIYVPGLNEGDPDIRCLVVKPREMPRHKCPGMIFFFAGGMIFGSPEGHLTEMAEYVSELGCVIVAPQYRLLPKYTYPCAVDDAEAVVNYVVEHADELNINPKKLVATGASAGGYLAACTSIRLKMRGGFQFAGQLLGYPVIDDTFAFPSSNIYFGEIWHPYDDQKVFETLLGPNYNRSATPPDAVPGRLKDFSGMPPTIILTGELDYGHDPIIAFAQGLMNAGIFCDLHVWGGCFHGFFTLVPDSNVARRAIRDIIEGLRDLMTGQCVLPE